MSEQIVGSADNNDQVISPETNQNFEGIIRRLKDWQRIQILTLQEVIQAVIRKGNVENETISQAFDRIKGECEENLKRLQSGPKSDLTDANISAYQLIIDNLISVIEHDETGLQERLTLHEFLSCVDQALR
jgi:hypothetical protein